LYSGTDGCTVGRVSHIEPPFEAGADGAGALDATCDSGCRGAGAGAGRERLTGSRDEVRGACPARASARRLGVSVVMRVAGGATLLGSGLAASGVMTPSDSVTGAVDGVGASGAMGA
jgi:hypothetical protein